MCLARPQLEELSLLLAQLRQHQARLASVRHFAIGQLLQHQLTFPSCQVSAGGPSQGWGPPWGPGSAMLACAPSCPCSSLSCCLALSLVPACSLLDATAGHCAAIMGPTPLVLGSRVGGWREIPCAATLGRAPEETLRGSRPPLPSMLALLSPIHAFGSMHHPQSSNS